MKKNLLYIACLLFVLASLTMPTRAQIKVPAPSPTVTLVQEIGLTKVELRYSRPGMKGREIFGHLIPYGKVWRTGANQNTRLTFYEEMIVGGKKFPKGVYALHTIPGKKEWTIIINKKQGFGNRYDQSQDLHRFKVKPAKTDVTYETCTIDFSNFDKNSADIRIAWENTMVSFRIATEVDKKIVKQIDRMMDNPEKTLAGAYYTSARYYLETGRDLNKALKWATKAAELRPDAYWMLFYKARIEGKLKKYKTAIATAKLSIKAAEVRKNPDFIRMNKELIAQWEKMK